MMKSKTKATLVLANGMVFEGCSVGQTGTVIGETVFTTAMTGYQEALTDPSGFGQIITQTFPLIGNYGVNSFDSESDRSFVKGYVVREWCEAPSNFRCEGTLDTFLKEHQIVGICDIDTRQLTKTIRESGVMNGAITTEPYVLETLLEQIRTHKTEHAVQTVSCKKPISFQAENAKRKVALFDFGCKNSIREALLNRGCDVTVVPYNTTAEQVKAMNVDGIMLSSGPGNPEENTEVIENLKEIIKLQIPTFGICLGHLLLALANGAKCEKLLYGHRGENQPVIDVDMGRTFVTSQNHGYALLSETLPASVGYVSHKNANDGSCEGVRYHNTPAFTVQFHPEACGGPEDTAYLFDQFMDMIDKKGE